MGGVRVSGRPNHDPPGLSGQLVWLELEIAEWGSSRDRRPAHELGFVSRAAPVRGLMQVLWGRVNGIDAHRVAQLLGFKQAREKRKYACVCCDSTDALHAYPERFCCFSCGGSWSNVDAAAFHWGLNPNDNADAWQALKRLAASLGLSFTRPTHNLSPARRFNSPKGDPRSKLTEDSSRLVGREEVYGVLVEITKLGPGGRLYLEERGIDPGHAAAWGVRSLEDSHEWERIAAELKALGIDKLQTAGLMSANREWTFPWGGRRAALAFPYHGGASDDDVRSIRFRHLGNTAPAKRYRSLRGARQTHPFLAPLLDVHPSDLGEVVVCEGELDTLTLTQRGRLAVGVPGAPSRAVLAWLCTALKEVPRTICWFDADDAGEKHYEKLRDALQAAHGADWIQAHLVRRRSPFDVNETALRARAAA